LMGTVTRLDDIKRARQAAQPASVSNLENPEARARHYRRRAKELQAISGEVLLKETCLTLLSLAESYRQMAAALERRIRPATKDNRCANLSTPNRGTNRTEPLPFERCYR